MRLPTPGLAFAPPDCGTVHLEERMERNDAIAWAVATGVWIGVLGLLLWLASRERPRTVRWLRWFGPRMAGGLALWVVVFGATRWAERKLGLRAESHPRAVRSSGAQSGSRSP
ncbi:MAG TPA: hypothetical protein VFI53_11680 [Myxococcaceae bacterium]|nr:hypothetical protein [Myxococcaceae bacterium]